MPRANSSSLATRVALVVLVFCLGAIWALAYLTTSRLHQSVARLLADQQFTSVSLMAADIEEKVRLRFQVLENIASQLPPAVLADPDTLYNTLRERPILRNLFAIGIVAISPEGQTLGSHPFDPRRKDVNYAEFEYFQEVMAKGKSVVGRPRIGSVSGKPSMAFAVPVFGPSRKIVAVLVGYTTLSDAAMFGFLESGTFGRTGWLAITAPAHKLIVTATDPTRILTPTATPGTNRMFDRFMEGYEGSGISVNSKGIETLTSAKQIPSAGWFLQGVLPTEEAFAPIREMETLAYSAAAVISIFISLLIWAATRRLLKPLGEASARIRGMARGKTVLSELPVQREDEVGGLVASFNMLVRQRKADEAELMLASNVFQHTMDGILVTDPAGTIVSVNPAFAEITGYAAEEALGRKPNILRSDHHEPAFYQGLWNALLKEGRWEGEIWNRRKNGEVFLEWLSIASVLDGDGQPARYVGVFNDITEMRRKDDHIRHLAFHDSLTGLPNRALFHDRLQHALDIAARDKTRLGVMFVDMDRFKQINDSLGHDVGDELLQQLAARLAECLRDSDTVARVGGDEFVVMVRSTEALNDCAAIAQRIMDSVTQPVRVRGHEMQVGASIGIALYPDDGTDVVTLMKHADTAMYAAKAAGRGTYRFFQPVMTVKAVERLKLEMELRNAVANGELELFYQPKMRLEDESVCGLEALVRWRHPVLGLVPPGEFIPLAEETGIINQLGDWVLEEACRQLGEWQSAGSLGSLRVAVNISAKQLQGENLVERIVALCRRHGILPTHLEFELTESTVMANPAENAEVFNCLRALGITIAMDDFGTGYSSLAYLRRLPLDILKIDRSFVMNVESNPGDAQIVRTILALAQSLGLQVVAEGVETREQAEFLRACGCPMGQGYLYARPEPAKDVARWLQRASVPA